MNNNVPNCSTHCENIQLHKQANLIFIERLREELNNEKKKTKKVQKENERLRARVEELTGKTKSLTAVESPRDEENNGEDWEIPDSVTTENCYDEEGSNSSPSVSLEKGSHTPQERVKLKSVESSNTDNNSLGDNEDIRDKDELESKNVIPDEEAKEIYSAAKLKWEDDSRGNSCKKLYSTVSYHKKFVTGDDSVLLPEEKPTVTIGVKLPEWGGNEAVLSGGSNKAADKHKKEEDVELRRKRHDQLENKESKRKRWDAQQAREDLNVARLKNNAYRKGKTPSLVSFLPTNFETVLAISVGDCCVPIDAFGVALPRHTMTEYRCDRISLMDGQ